MSLEINLIEGERGKLHVTSDDARTENAVIFGRGRKVLNMDEMFDAVLVGNNTVRILSGVLYSNGMFIRIDREDYKEVTIENGLGGTFRNDLICIRYERNIQTHIEAAYLVVKKGTASENTATDPSYITGDILEFASVDEFPLYRVHLDGIHPTLEPMFEVADAMDNIVLYEKIRYQQQELASHQQNYMNPHNVTAEHLHLENVDNTADIDKIVSNPQKEYIQGVEESLEKDISDVAAVTEMVLGKISTHLSDKNNPHQVTKEQVGLGNVNNTADMDKPVSTATQKVLDNLESNKADKIVGINKELLFTKSNAINMQGNPFTEVVYGEDKFVAVGQWNNFYSYDGINWTLCNDALNTESIVAYGNGMFVAFEQGYTGIVVSDDGINWNYGVLSVPSNATIRSVTFGNGVFVVVGIANGQKCCITLQNGIWGPVTYNENYGDKIRFLDDRFFVVGENKIVETYNGKPYATYTFEEYADFDFNDIAYGDGVYVVIGTNKDTSKTTIFRTTDFSTLTPCIENIPVLRSITYVNGAFIAVGENGALYYSNDSIKWKHGDCGIDAYSIACSDDKVVVVGTENYSSYISFTEMKETKTVEEAVNDLQEQVNKAVSLKDYIIKQTIQSEALSIKGNEVCSEDILLESMIGYTPLIVKTDTDQETILCSQSDVYLINDSFHLQFCLKNFSSEEFICSPTTTILWIRDI